MVKATIDKNYLVVAHVDKIFFINIVSGLTYINLIKNKLSFRDYYNKKMNYESSEGKTLIFSSSRPTMIIAYLYGKIIGLNSNNDAGLEKANIQVDINSNLLDYLSAIRQAYIN